MVDSTDKERMKACKDELDIMLKEEELKGLPVLVLANKQDVYTAMSESDV